MKHENEDDTNCNWFACNSHQRIGTGTGGLGNKRTSGDHPNYSIIEIGQNTERLEETCCLGNSSEKLSANVGLVGWLVGLFNSISTFVGYLMPKPFF